jgi:transcriptional regulator with XRE-family HTH domain
MEFYKVGIKIKELRKEKKITQEELSKKVGITRQTLSKLESGQIHKVSLQAFLKILDLLDYEMDISPIKPFYYFDVNQL